MARLPKNIIKKYGITKKAWRIFKSRSTRSTKKKGRSSSNRRGKKRMGKKSFLSTSTLFKFIRLGALLAPGLKRGGDVWAAEQNAFRALGEGLGAYSGFQDGEFDVGRAVSAWTPYVFSVAMTHGVQKLAGIIRRL